jgi:putative ABC transport system permease protein
MLGIVIGVGAVIALTNIGEGATARVKADIGKLGDNLLIVRPGAQRRSISFTQAPAFKLADVEAIRREVSGVHQVAPTTATRWRPSSSAAVNILPACSVYFRTSR